MRTAPLRIAVVGCGALGSYYGAKLCRDGLDVHFLLRSDFEAVRRHGVRVQSPEGDFHVQPACARSPHEIGVVDLVLVSLKTTANSEFPSLLPPLVGAGTAVLTLQNGLGNEETLARLIPAGQILGGLCRIGVNRVAPGRIQHFGEGRITLGEFQRWPEPRTHDIASAFRHAGIPCQVTDSLLRARWQKLVWNIPFNGCGVAGSAGIEFLDGRRPPSEAGRVRDCLPTDQLLADPAWLCVIVELMGEVIRAARALGHALPDSEVEQQLEITRRLQSYKASTLLDFESGRPLELESLFLEPLRQARRAGVEVPRMETLCAVLRRLAGAC